MNRSLNHKASSTRRYIYWFVFLILFCNTFRISLLLHLSSGQLSVVCGSLRYSSCFSPMHTRVLISFPSSIPSPIQCVLYCSLISVNLQDSGKKMDPLDDYNPFSEPLPGLCCFLLQVYVLFARILFDYALISVFGYQFDVPAALWHNFQHSAGK